MKLLTFVERFILENKKNPRPFSRGFAIIDIGLFPIRRADASDRSGGQVG